MATIDIEHICPECGQQIFVPVEFTMNDHGTVPALLQELIEGAEKLERWANLQTQTLRRIANKVAEQ